ncbi:flagellar motor switch protein FliG [Aceticella autotrophica]|uniref:Flagellar motor switch protein FliG n=1 Tax=Aceticella autotrophica TaxID=2755338 RepID=A0A975AUD4_9THEO|nr:flagellar motor switch protein FliG [Aceticella autotrophica]QSZ26612.1 flagellar motor switch protein FliG [Aceticella autotrophica]
MGRSSMTGRQKCAMLLIALGPSNAAQIYKHLREEEIEQLTLEIANIKNIKPEEKEKILEDFYSMCVAQEYIVEGGIEYAKDILEKALGTQEAYDVINKLTSSLKVRPFDFIRRADPSQVLSFIQNEHPQTIAMILSYLKPQQAGTILSSLPENIQSEVAMRIATMEGTSPEIVKEVERILEKKLSSLVTQDYTAVGGIQAIVEILNSVDRGTEKNIIDALETKDVELAEEIKRRMFIFEDIITLDSRSIQRVLREVENHDIALALKGSSEEVQKVIYSNMSKRLADMIKEDIEYMGPVRLKDVEEAQQKIVNIIRKLEDAGEIVISRGGGDDIIV